MMRHFALAGIVHILCGFGFSGLFLCGAAQGDDLFAMKRVAEGVFVYEAPYAIAAPANRGAIGNFGFIVGRDAVAVIDTGGSFLVGSQFAATIRTITDKPVKYVINTHFHPDHVLGNGAFRAPGVTFVGHARLAEALRARSQIYLDANRRLLGDAAFAGTEIVLPDLGVADHIGLDLGDRVLELDAQETAHTNTDLTIYDVKTKTFFVGDLIFVRHLPAIDGSLNGWFKVMDRLEQHGSDRIVPGHGPASLRLEDAILPQKRYLSRLRTEVRKAVADGIPLAQAAVRVGLSERDVWALFDDFNSRNATAAYHELEWE